MERVVRKGQQLAALSKERGGVSVCHWRWVSRMFRSPLGLKSVHLRVQLADVPFGRLVIKVAFAPLVCQLKLSVVARSTDPAGRSAKRTARRDRRKLFLGV